MFLNYSLAPLFKREGVFEGECEGKAEGEVVCCTIQKQI